MSTHIKNGILIFNMKKNILIFLCNILFLQIIYAQSEFVRVKGNRFYLNNNPHYYIGANYWYGGVLALQKDKQKGIERLRKELDFLKSNGITNVRVLSGAEGKGLVNGVERV